MTNAKSFKLLMILIALTSLVACENSLALSPKAKREPASQAVKAEPIRPLPQATPADEITNSGELLTTTWNFADKNLQPAALEMDSNTLKFRQGEGVEIKKVSGGFDHNFIGGTFNNTVINERGQLTIGQPKKPSSENLDSPLPSRHEYLKAYFPFDGAFTDLSPSKLSSEAAPGARLVEKAKRGKGALHFDAKKSLVKLNSNISDVLNTTATLSFWIKTAQTGNDKIWLAPGIIGREYTDRGGDIFWGWLDGKGNIGFQVSDEASLKSKKPINDSQWHFISMTRNASSGQIKLYVDGALQGSRKSIEGVLQPVYNTIGRIENTPAFFEGSIDDLSVWSSDLNETEVALLQSGNKGPQVAGTNVSISPARDLELYSYWNFDTSWVDASGKSLTLTPQTESSLAKGGKSLGSAAFDAKTKSSVSTKDDLGLSESSFSVGFWSFLRLNSLNTNQFILGLGSRVNGQCLQVGYNADGRFIINSSDRDISAGSPSRQQDLGKWIQWTITFNQENRTASIFRNGLLVGSSRVGDGFTSGGQLTIGGGCGTAAPFTGNIDDLAFWKTALPASEVALLTGSEKQKLSGTWISPVVDRQTEMPFSGFTAKSSYPFYKELGVKNVSESRAYFGNPEAVTVDMARIWHFNETGKTFENTSGLGRAAEAVGRVTTTEGLFNRALDFSGDLERDAYVEIPDSPALASLQDRDSTYSVWYYPKALPRSSEKGQAKDAAHAIVMKAGFHFGLMYTAEGRFAFSRFNKDESFAGVSSNATYAPGRWYHVVGVLEKDDGVVSLYVNGKLAGTQKLARPISLRNYGHTPFRVGAAQSCKKAYCYPANGKIDELALWTRSLKPSEVREIYRRGANRVAYQVRSCATNPCTDEKFIGPDGTPSTYYSELQNDSPDRSLEIMFLKFGPNAQPKNNRYLQIKVALESDDDGGACVDGTNKAIACLPELAQVEFSPGGRFPASVGGLSNRNPVRAKTLEGVIVDSQPFNCAKIQLSNDDGASWKFWDGSKWSEASTQANLANELTQERLNLFNQQQQGKFKYRALLSTNSAQTENCVLKSVSLQYR